MFESGFLGSTFFVVIVLDKLVEISGVFQFLFEFLLNHCSIPNASHSLI